MAFVDDYTTWVTGASAEANREGIQAIIEAALVWERHRSGATFNCEKTCIVHFTRNRQKHDIWPKEKAKILGVQMDSELRFRDHLAKTATKGLKAAMALRRLHMLSPAPARQLFTATVAPVVDYASNVWEACMWLQANAISQQDPEDWGPSNHRGFPNGCNSSSGGGSIYPYSLRTTHHKRAAKLWVNLHALPETNPARFSNADKAVQEISISFAKNCTCLRRRNNASNRNEYSRSAWHLGKNESPAHHCARQRNSSP